MYAHVDFRLSAQGSKGLFYQIYHQSSSRVTHLGNFGPICGT